VANFTKHILEKLTWILNLDGYEIAQGIGDIDPAFMETYQYAGQH